MLLLQIRQLKEMLEERADLLKAFGEFIKEMTARRQRVPRHIAETVKTLSEASNSESKESIPEKGEWMN